MPDPLRIIQGDRQATQSLFQSINRTVSDAARISLAATSQATDIANKTVAAKEAIRKNTATIRHLGTVDYIREQQERRAQENHEYEITRRGFAEKNKDLEIRANQLKVDNELIKQRQLIGGTMAKTAIDRFRGQFTDLWEQSGTEAPLDFIQTIEAETRRKIAGGADPETATNEAVTKLESFVKSFKPEEHTTSQYDAGTTAKLESILGKDAAERFATERDPGVIGVRLARQANVLDGTEEQKLNAQSLFGTTQELLNWETADQAMQTINAEQNFVEAQIQKYSNDSGLTPDLSKFDTDVDAKGARKFVDNLLNKNLLLQQRKAAIKRAIRNGDDVNELIRSFDEQDSAPARDPFKETTPADLTKTASEEGKKTAREIQEGGIVSGAFNRAFGNERAGDPIFAKKSVTKIAGESLAGKLNELFDQKIPVETIASTLAKHRLNENPSFLFRSGPTGTSVSKKAKEQMINAGQQVAVKIPISDINDILTDPDFEELIKGLGAAFVNKMTGIRSGRSNSGKRKFIGEVIGELYSEAALQTQL